MVQVSDCIVCIVGFPGVGKLTIARALSRLTGAVVVDNHWINDPILKLVTNDDSTAAPEAVWPLVAKVREAVLETIAALGPPGTSYIFTYAGADEDPGDRKALQEYREVAIRRNSRFIPVRALCSEEESIKRIQSFERRGKKLTAPDETIENFRNYTPLDPRMPDTLTLDVTNLSAEEAALAIVAHIGSTNA